MFDSLKSIKTFDLIYQTCLIRGPILDAVGSIWDLIGASPPTLASHRLCDLYGEHGWDLPFLQAHLPDFVVTLVTSFSFRFRASPDRLIWEPHLLLFLRRLRLSSSGVQNGQYCNSYGVPKFQFVCPYSFGDFLMTFCLSRTSCCTLGSISPRVSLLWLCRHLLALFLWLLRCKSGVASFCWFLFGLVVLC